MPRTLGAASIEELRRIEQLINDLAEGSKSIAELAAEDRGGGAIHLLLQDAAQS